MSDGEGMKGGEGGGRCASAARVLAAVRLSLSEEISSSSSLPSLPSELKAHLAACASCATEAAALDPTLLFAPLAASASPEPAVTGRRPAPPVAEDARRVADAVLDEVRRRARVTTPTPLAGPSSARRFRRLAQAAALAGLTAGLAGLLRWEGPRSPNAAAPAPATPRPAAGLLPDASVRPLIEGMRSPNARVYEFAAASPQEPSVVFVANPNADL
ncbi:MAG: hypothetical protein WCC53_03310 [Thermoanaerobaculia bacterium]